MEDSFTFRCWSCEGNSRYTYRAKEKREVSKMAASRDDYETRTYYCEHCKKPNELTIKRSIWMLVDNAREENLSTQK